MYINTQTNEVVSEQDIKLANPNTSFSIPFNPPEEYKWIFPVPQPAYNPVIQVARETAPELTVLGHYEQRWEVVNIFGTPEEGTAAIAADALARYKASIPQEISRAQFILALLHTSPELLDAVEAAIANSDRATQINYKERLTFRRDFPLVATMAMALNKSDEEIDAIFILGATL